MNIPVVKLENLKKDYYIGSTPVPVLKGLNIQVDKGEFIGIMGSSGSGKSTLLNILGLLDNPTSGCYKLDNINVESLHDNKLAELRNSKIGFIFQSFNLFPHLTVEQNIEVPMIYKEIPKRKRAQIAKKLASQVKLSHRLTHKPSELSGGERQRIAIARALANNPSFLLADEPTGNLDEQTSEEIMLLFKQLHKERGGTIVMVTHDPELERIFDRVIKLRDGNVEY